MAVEDEDEEDEEELEELDVEVGVEKLPPLLEGVQVLPAVLPEGVEVLFNGVEVFPSGVEVLPEVA